MKKKEAEVEPSGASKGKAKPDVDSIAAEIYKAVDTLWDSLACGPLYITEGNLIQSEEDALLGNLLDLIGAAQASAQHIVTGHEKRRAREGKARAIA